jgi:hypothetical protein
MVVNKRCANAKDIFTSMLQIMIHGENDVPVKINAKEN